MGLVELLLEVTDSWVPGRPKVADREEGVNRSEARTISSMQGNLKGFILCRSKFKWLLVREGKTRLP